MLESLLQWDREVFIFLNGLGSPTWDALWVFITNKFSSVPLYAFLLYLVFKTYGLKNTFLIMLVTALMITFTDQLSNFFKHYFERPRPCQEESLKEIIRFAAPRCGRYGYFSGHAVNSMVVAVFIGLLLKHRYRNLIFFLLLWSVVVSYSRIYLGVHYPLDVITGMAVGAVTGFAFYTLQLKLNRKFGFS